MTTQLLAEKSGWISIVEVQKITPKYLVLGFAMEKKTRKVFIAEQGVRWEFFSDVDEATRWIKSEVV
jgi:hypothetical protein